MRRYSAIRPDLIGFDIDCVVADTMEAFIRLSQADYGIAVSPHEITSFQVQSCLAMDESIVNEIFSRLLTDPVANGLQPVEHAVSVLTQLSTHAPLTFITARPHAEPIDNWLRTVLPQAVYAKSRLVAMGDHDGKVSHVKQMGLHYFVDDRLETCLELAKSGLFPIVFDQPWNIGRHALASVASWIGIREMVEVLAYA
ncbi:MAG: hypothetical protein BM485_08485 [Desulfobulbaceae bacterium DB1]|nr:MAG: hypothetical protein BM485_08485 [Desulfobulbaceae bacterium DB1]